MTPVNMLLLLYLVGVAVFIGIGAAIVHLAQREDEDDPRIVEIRRLLETVEMQTGMKPNGLPIYMGITWPVVLYKYSQKRRGK